MHTNEDLRPLHHVVVQTSVDVVSEVTAEDLARPTPCTGWDLAELLAHMTVQHLGFAAAARGNGAQVGLWDPETVRAQVLADPAGAYAAAAADVLDAFAGDVLEAPFRLPELAPDAPFPGAMAIGFHYIDYVVHGWDVARSLRRGYELPADVLAAALPLALFVPDGDFRAVANAPFGPAVAASDSGSDLDRIVAHLGRAPRWEPDRR
ncbi:TIGR03086 family metal-binding protein [Candidatus Mycobacterium wuenschmannii]|uniref:TIGR03086 family metal-binding protein n=1 Tax=Candidatus Mycobacterium wuenschmannii TaxID=3027808 RepID=A0ABY8VVT8_9MYCO|nr:TIGR03086 family metal-binding protein [Candidatus Mycobacterium wuenschmannii]WIM87769.1 TIGR03086 family metal-binding protein [Candidatus Mycobacterium wuenschmannii]